MSFHPNEVVRRARVATALACGVLGLLTGKFFFTQVLRHQQWVLQSGRNRLREIPIPAPRGVIYDRAGKVIAENAVSYSVSLLARNEDSVAATITRLGKIIPITPKDSIEAIRRYRREAPRPATIIPDASFDKISVLEEHRIDFPGLIMQPTPRRVYPAGRAVGPFVGYTREINETQLTKLSDSGYKAGQQIGNEGLERQYETSLRGREGSRFVEVDARNRVVREEGAREELPALPGKDIHTNIDLDLQTYVANLFGDSLVGGAVALDPKTGGVLAIYSAPAYDPNRFIGGPSVSFGQFYDSLLADPRKPLYNKALQGLYAPGSTFKLATSVIGLEDGVVTMSDHMPEPCVGYFYFGNRTWHCWQKNGHGNLDLAGAIENSCDVYFYQLGIKIGLERMAAGGVSLGFTKKSGIDLPSERTPEWPDKVQEYYNNRYGPRGWTQSVVLNLAIGQGENSQTILNMARFYTALVTDGAAAQPSILQRAPTRTKIVSLSTDQLALIRKALVGVVAGGTATSAAIKGVVMGGKTGTAQSGKFVDGVELNHAWFVGYAPDDDPKIVVAVMIEFGGHGTRAAHIASAIIGQYLHSSANFVNTAE